MFKSRAITFHSTIDIFEESKDVFNSTHKYKQGPLRNKESSKKIKNNYHYFPRFPYYIKSGFD